jgi:hypothetical protein
MCCVMSGKLGMVVGIAAGLAVLGGGVMAMQDANKKPQTPTATKPSPEAVKPVSTTPAQPPADTKAPAQPADAAEAEMMKKWMEYMTPGAEHKAMEYYVGEWIGDMKMWQVPGQPPSEEKTNSKFELIMDGRYLIGEHSGQFMGMPFQGRSTMAYSNLTKLIQHTWIDNFGTGIWITSGKSDGKVCTLSGKMDDPMSGKQVDTREVMTILDANTYRLEMFGPSPIDAKEFKNMEITYRRTGGTKPAPGAAGGGAAKNIDTTK